MVISQNSRGTNFHWIQQVIWHHLLWLHPQILGIGWKPNPLPSIPNSWWPCSIMIFHGLNTLELVGLFFRIIFEVETFNGKERHSLGFNNKINQKNQIVTFFNLTNQSYPTWIDFNMSKLTIGQIGIWTFLLLIVLLVI